MKKYAHHTMKLCDGICHRHIPSHIRPADCKHCANLKICNGVDDCKTIVIKSEFGHCDKCVKLLYPIYERYICYYGGHEYYDTKCKQCKISADGYKKYLEFMEHLPSKFDPWKEYLDKYGGINDDYVVLIQFDGVGLRHSSCTTPQDDKETAFSELTYQVPACNDIITDPTLMDEVYEYFLPSYLEDEGCTYSHDCDTVRFCKIREPATIYSKTLIEKTKLLYDYGISEFSFRYHYSFTYY
jgi:hypothetical protein